MSLSNVDVDDAIPTATDVETEQLINEIEQLTSRALQETNQWSHTLTEPAKPENVDLNNASLENNNSWGEVANN